MISNLRNGFSNLVSRNKVYSLFKHTRFKNLGARCLSCPRPVNVMKSYRNCFSVWYILERLGLPRCNIIRFRRSMKRFSYPWILYCIPAATCMGIADAVAQNLYGKKEKYDYRSTLTLVLIGFFLIGPVLSKWNLFLYWRMRHLKRRKYLASRILLDIAILAPVLLAAVMATFDHDYIYHEVFETKLYNDYEGLKNLLQQRYKEPFLEILKYNAMTRPLFLLLLCNFIPGRFRRIFKNLYEITFSTYGAEAFHKARLGEVTPPKTKEVVIVEEVKPPIQGPPSKNKKK